jgi:hypothetical protein
MGVHVHRSFQRHLDQCLAEHLSAAEQSLKPLSARAGVYTSGPSRIDGKNCLGPTSASPPDLGIYRRQVSDGSHLVVLSLLDSEISE